MKTLKKYSFEKRKINYLFYTIIGFMFGIPFWILFIVLLLLK